ncbi:MAG: heparan-alpha-glucosaminide N-acetyltransferase domain-containing protein [Vicinamibacterales bacterium]
MNDRVVHVHAHRVIFIDLARALAVVLMVAGHTSSALLAGSYQSSPWYDVWMFQRGLTSALFLLLAGFAFSVATARHWTSHVRLSLAVVKRLRRFGLFIVLGYGLHFPVLHFSELATVSTLEWRSFVAVDVLQLIGVTLVALQALVLVTRTRRAFMIAAFAVAVALVAASPPVWRTDWTARMPLPLAAYLSPATGSLFPPFPWAAYVFVGAAAGQLYARWGAAHLGAFARWGMLTPAALLMAGGLTLGADIPADVAVRTGACLFILGLTAMVSRHLSQLPHVFGAVAQESLVVYFVHLCIVYGSIWNPGLASVYGGRLTLFATLGAVLAVVAAMIGLAWQWNRFKHVRPRTARWVSVAAGTVLVGRLL